MTSADRFAALLAAMLTSSAVVFGAAWWILRTLWSIKGSWDRTNSELHALVARVASLIADKDREHARLESRLDRADARIERHEIWHDDHPPPRG